MVFPPVYRSGSFVYDVTDRAQPRERACAIMKHLMALMVSSTSAITPKTPAPVLPEPGLSCFCLRQLGDVAGDAPCLIKSQPPSRSLYRADRHGHRRALSARTGLP